MKKYKIIDIEEKRVYEWDLDDILEEINRDRSEHWSDYNEEDWREGWKEWVEGEFLSLVDDDECVVIDCEADTVEDDFQFYVYTNGEVVPRGTPIGIEHKEKLYLFSDILFG